MWQELLITAILMFIAKMRGLLFGVVYASRWYRIHPKTRNQAPPDALNTGLPFKSTMMVSTFMLSRTIEESPHFAQSK